MATRMCLLMCFFVLIITSGCAFGTRNVTLNPIKTPLNLDASGQSVSLDVTDKRNPELKPVVGHVKNAYGMKTAEVVADKEVIIWVRDSIVEELKRFGATIVSSQGATDSNVSMISVDVLVCYAQAYWNYGAEVSILLSVKKDGHELIREKNYSGKATLGTNWSASSASYQKVLELAMEDMLQKLMPDLITVIKK